MNRWIDLTIALLAAPLLVRQKCSAVGTLLTMALKALQGGDGLRNRERVSGSIAAQLFRKTFGKSCVQRLPAKLRLTGSPAASNPSNFIGDKTSVALGLYR